MLPDFEEVDHITDWPTIPILSGFSQFCLKIPNPNQHVDQDRKNPDFDISCDFSSDDFRQKLSSQNTRTGFQSISISNYFGGAFHRPPWWPLPSAVAWFVGDQKLSQFHILTWLDCLITGTLLLFPFFKYLNSKSFFFKWWTNGFSSL